MKLQQYSWHSRFLQVSLSQIFVSALRKKEYVVSCIENFHIDNMFSKLYLEVNILKKYIQLNKTSITSWES